jgi:hypothetical protein
MKARTYDPALGTFLSPDTVVPDAGRVSDYNRFAYTRNNPLKYSDPSGHFSEDQLKEWYGDDWRSLFTDEWIQLLLDQDGSQLFGAQLGDLVLTGNSESGLAQSILVLNSSGQLALWDLANKTGTSLASIGGTTPDTLALYRMVGGETGSADTRYGYLMGGTRTLPATNGVGSGPFKMVKLDGYSPRDAGLDAFTSVAADWFMGQGGQGSYIHNYSQFQGFQMDLVSWLGAVFTGGGAAYTAVDVSVAAATGATIAATGPVLAIGGSVVTVYQASKYRQIYQMKTCSAIGVNWCP